ncbi:unnamed protein product [Prorocentrum cordatum]|uniref:Uncharacterized protein n=1 Tax=Prorocentrum cordatum TaxID=2364126 RepID=A0ABN9QQD0_9DINO|nr:unnamed protein product [Polarella glacialis]
MLHSLAVSARARQHRIRAGSCFNASSVDSPVQGGAFHVHLASDRFRHVAAGAVGRSTDEPICFAGGAWQGRPSRSLVLISLCSSYCRPASGQEECAFCPPRFVFWTSSLSAEKGRFCGVAGQASCPWFWCPCSKFSPKRR